MKLATWFPAAFSPFTTNTLLFICPNIPSNTHLVSSSNQLFLRISLCSGPLLSWGFQQVTGGVVG